MKLTLKLDLEVMPITAPAGSNTDNVVVARSQFIPADVAGFVVEAVKTYPVATTYQFTVSSATVRRIDIEREEQ